MRMDFLGLGTKPSPPPDVIPEAAPVFLNAQDPDVLIDGFPNVNTQKEPTMATLQVWVQWFNSHGYPDSAYKISELYTDWAFKYKYGYVPWRNVPKPTFPIEKEPVPEEENKLHWLYWDLKRKMDNYSLYPEAGRFTDMQKAYDTYMAEFNRLQELYGVTSPAATETPVGTVPEPPGGVAKAGILDQLTGYLGSPLLIGGLVLGAVLLLGRGKGRE